MQWGVCSVESKAHNSQKRRDFVKATSVGKWRESKEETKSVRSLAKVPFSSY